MDWLEATRQPPSRMDDGQDVNLILTDPIHEMTCDVRLGRS